MWTSGPVVAVASHGLHVLHVLPSFPSDRLCMRCRPHMAWKGMDGVHGVARHGKEWHKTPEKWSVLSMYICTLYISNSPIYRRTLTTITSYSIFINHNAHPVSVGRGKRKPQKILSIHFKQNLLHYDQFVSVKKKSSPVSCQIHLNKQLLNQLTATLSL